jgi:predicted AlkP superfamily phosphohydrolase/phosphomutase
MNSASAWSSIVTGYNPGRHGVYDFGEAPPQRGTQWRPVTAADRKRDPFWRILSAAGQRVGIINVPISYPAETSNGFMLAGMDAPSIASPAFAHPPGLCDELRGEGIDYMIDAPNLGPLSIREPHQLPLPVQHMVDTRARTILYLMQTRQWDALMAVYVATDRMQHFFWPDVDLPLTDPSWSPIRSVYQQIDSHIANMLELTDADTTTLVVSDHGFGPFHAANYLLNQLFAELGLLRFGQGKGRLTGLLLKQLLQYGRQTIPFRWQDPLARAFPGLRLRALSERMYAQTDWGHTKVFTMPFGQICVNLRGRQPEGIVSEDDYQPLRDRVRDILLKVIDPATGHPVVRAVHRREDLFDGPYVDRAADLVVEWDPELLGCPWRYLGPEGPVTIEVPERKVFGGRVKGTHRAYGILIACGPSIRPGARVLDATLYDIAPTVLYLQGHPIPEDMDGKVLTGIFTDEHLRQNPVHQVKPVDHSEQGTIVSLDTDEARQIEERLRGLGYLE